MKKHKHKSMKKICWQGKAFKQLSFGKIKSAGRNSSGCITLYHRGGGSKRLQRRIDYQRNTLATGLVERIEYDPNRSSKIALIRWLRHVSETSDQCSGPSRSESAPLTTPKLLQRTFGPVVKGSQRSSEFTLRDELACDQVPVSLEHFDTKPMLEQQSASSVSRIKKKTCFFSYIIACDQLKSGDEIINMHFDSEKTSHDILASSKNDKLLPQKAAFLGDLDTKASKQKDKLKFLGDSRLYQKIGTNCTLAKAPLGSFIHNIEAYPGKGGILVRAAGTYAQLVQKFDNTRQCIVRLPSGRQILLDSLCRATIGIVSNTAHSTRKFTKAGQSRWLGRKPVVRGVAMNPIDHPHGGGSGRTKGGRPSVSPWGKPTKGARTKRVSY
jgi:ribosomal protein L2